MADATSPDPALTNPIGTPFDQPATLSDLDTSTAGLTIFSLLKGCLLYLATIAEGK